MKKVYLAGPMRGIPEFNFPAFHDAAAYLRRRGWNVFSPAERDMSHYGKDLSVGNPTGDEQQAVDEHGFNIREAMAADLKFICEEADAIALLPGWENSRGARAEKAAAEALGIEVIYLRGAPMTDPPTANPKDLLGIKKVQLGLLPAAGTIYGALAMETGAAKYGPYNWRALKVKMTIYLDAIERHLFAIRDGHDLDDGVNGGGKPHLGHIIACASILADAIEGGFLIDDRPLPGPAPGLLDKWEKKHVPVLQASTIGGPASIELTHPTGWAGWPLNLTSGR